MEPGGPAHVNSLHVYRLWANRPVGREFTKNSTRGAKKIPPVCSSKMLPIGPLTRLKNAPRMEPTTEPTTHSVRPISRCDYLMHAFQSAGTSQICTNGETKTKQLNAMAKQVATASLCWNSFDTTTTSSNSINLRSSSSSR